jgi:hypothetical protein
MVGEDCSIWHRLHINRKALVSIGPQSRPETYTQIPIRVLHQARDIIPVLCRIPGWRLITMNCACDNRDKAVAGTSHELSTLSLMYMPMQMNGRLPNQP